jgi:hypothetical protein
MSSKRQPPLARVRPSEIWFTFGRVNDRFSGCGRRLEETLEEIKRGTLGADDLPPIAVVTHDVAERDEEEEDESDEDDRRRRRDRSKRKKKPTMVRRYYSMNNRRLWVLKRCEELGLIEDVGVRLESEEACERLLRKGSRNFRLDRCTPGPVKLVPTPAPAKTTGGADETAEEKA